MPNGMRWVGLDVHAHASTLAMFDDATGEVITRRVNGRPIEVLDALRELPRPVRAVYEAGPRARATRATSASALDAGATPQPIAAGRRLVLDQSGTLVGLQCERYHCL